MTLFLSFKGIYKIVRQRYHVHFSVEYFKGLAHVTAAILIRAQVTQSYCFSAALFLAVSFRVYSAVGSSNVLPA